MITGLALEGNYVGAGLNQLGKDMVEHLSGMNQALLDGATVLTRENALMESFYDYVFELSDGKLLGPIALRGAVDYFTPPEEKLT